MVMKILKNKIQERKTKYIVGLLVLVLIVAGVAGYYAYTQMAPTDKRPESSSKINDVNYDKPTKEQQDTGAEAKKEALQKGDNDSSTPTSGPQITITSLNQTEDMVSVRTMIDTAIEGGTCTLTFSRANQTTITQTVNTQSLGSYYVCQGFDITKSGLEQGDWNLTITYTKDATTSKVEKVVTVG